MFLEILQTLIRVLFVFSILIIAFGLAFFIVFSKSKVFRSIACMLAVDRSKNLMNYLYSQMVATSQLAFSTIPMSLVRTFS